MIVLHIKVWTNSFFYEKFKKCIFIWKIRIVISRCRNEKTWKGSVIASQLFLGMYGALWKCLFCWKIALKIVNNRVHNFCQLDINLHCEFSDTTDKWYLWQKSLNLKCLFVSFKNDSWCVRVASISLRKIFLSAVWIHIYELQI